MGEQIGRGLILLAIAATAVLAVYVVLMCTVSALWDLWKGRR